MDSQRTIGEVPGSSGSGDSRSYISRMLREGVLVLLIGACLGTVATHAQDATWFLSPGSSDWNTGANWTGAAVPTGTATFDQSTVTTITLSSSAAIGTLQFNVGAPAYTFNLLDSVFTVTGTGIVNFSSNNAIMTNGNGARTKFLNTSTAGPATINNFGGATNFFNTSTAGNAIITNSSGITQFFDTSTAGNATITTNFGGQTQFSNASTAGTANIINSGGPTVFSDTSTAGNAAITNSNGGFMQFFNTSTAGNAIITNNSVIFFFNTSMAGNATITNNSGASTLFQNASTAGNAAIINNGGGTDFFNTSTAGNATITTNFGGQTQFSNASTAGNATITNNGGFTQFLNASTAGTATITTNFGGQTQFFDTSTAANSVINVNSGTTQFFNASTAANSTITTNNSGVTKFFDTSTGGQARFITTLVGIVDISNLTSGGMTAGSIEGAGNYELGSKTFSVGSNNLDTTVSGAITDGGSGGGTGGSLIKVGTGTLTLSGLNTYSGGTTVAGGVLSVGNNSNLGNVSGGLTLDGGELLASAVLFTARPVGLTANGGTLAAAPGVFAVIFGNLTGAGGLTVGDAVNTGTVDLGGTNTYQGRTKIVSGTTLQVISTGAALSPASAFIVNGTLYLQGFSGQIGSLAGTGVVSNVDTNDNDNTNAVLTVGGDNTSTTFSGIVQGGTGPPVDFGDSLGLIKIGTGTLTLSGANTYNGGTKVAGGVLSVTSDTNLGDPIGRITLAGGELLTTADGFNTARAVDLREGKGVNTLAAATGTTATYTGVFSDFGALTVGDGFNDGKVVLASGANTYSGGTTVLGGATLSVNTDAELGNANGGIILRFGGELLTSADFTSARSVSLNPLSTPNIIVTPLAPVSRNILAAAANTTATYTGLVFGTGGLAVGEVSGNNPGVVVLANLANSYTGGTRVQGGATLSVANDTNLGDQTGGITLAAGELLTTASGFSTARAVDVSPTAGRNILAAANGTTATYTGVLSDGGALVVGDGTHAGTVVLAGANTYSGGTVIGLGTLLVDNAQALGTGDVIVNGGVLAADPQPINVLGNYTQNAGGTLQLQVAGANQGQYDSLNVGGNAALGGTLQLISLGFQPKAGNQLTLVTTGGVVSGRFAQFVDPFATGPGFNTVDLVYGRNSVLLKFLNVTSPISPVVPTVPTTPTTPGVPPNVVETINFASFALTPNQHSSATLVDQVELDPKAAGLVGFLFKEPFANLPGDFEKISPDGLTAFYEISFSNANIQRLNLEGRLDDIHNGSTGFSSNMKVNGAMVNLEDKAGADGKSSKGVVEPILQPGPKNRWGVWVTGFGDFVSVDADGNAKGYDFTTGGVSLGIDYRITDQLAIGVMGEYSHTWTALNPSGHIDVDSGRGGLYTTWSNHGIYLNGAIYGGHNNYDSGRSSLGGLANGGTEGAEWSTFISGGYDFHFGHLSVGPITALQYTYVHIDGFSEKGSLAPMQIHSGSAESLRSDVGFRAFYQWQIGKILVEPSLKAAWEHEYKYSALPITAGFAGIPGPSATFLGPNEGHDSAVVSAGVSVRLTPAISTYVNYDGQLGRGNYDSNAVTGGVRLSF